jgi:ferrous iron transport protein B
MIREMEEEQSSSQSFNGREHNCRIALTGNPNSGKTSLFNRLTGANQKVGNWSGVTVEIKEGRARCNDRQTIIIDLPGTYSLSTCSPDEQVARDYLLQEKPDRVVDVVDASSLDRQMYLTVQLLELGIRPVIALNMWDEVTAKGIAVDVPLLSKLLGLTIVPTNARTGEGINELLAATLAAGDTPQKPAPVFPVAYPAEIETAITKLTAQLSAAGTVSCPLRWTALQLLELDHAVENEVAALPVGRSILDLRDKLAADLKRMLGDDPQTRIAEERYGFIAGAIKETVRYPAVNRIDLSEKIDAVLTDRILAFPLFFIFMWLLFQATFKLGEYPMGWIEALFGQLGTLASGALPEGIIRNLLVDGIIAGIGGVIVFLPNILILFLGISIMEDTGYMARTAFITDKLMHRIGLHGKSFIPMIMGLGCTVPAIMAARTLESPKDRIKTILLIPLISCSARLPVFVLFAGAFFPQHAGNVVFLFQIVLSFLAFGGMALLFKHTLFHKMTDYPFVMELPPYRLPTLRSVFIHLWQKTCHYLEKMGGVVLLFSIILWWAGNYPKSPALEGMYAEKRHHIESGIDISAAQRETRLHDIDNERQSALMGQTYIGRIGKFLEPAVRPFGSDWRGAVSLVTGFVAKEIVVGSMGVLYAVGNGSDDANENLRSKVREHFTPLSALAFMLFVLLYTPCLVAFITAVRELDNWKWSLFSLGYQVLFAWCMATIVYQAGRLFGLGG